jgi:thiol-disulfide isomerase/thioredoxin
LKTLSALKGKVVVLDFWATWCGPCIGSFPQVRELVEHYKGADVEVVGVTSIQGRVVNLQTQPIDTKDDPAKEMALMNDFMKAKDMTWTVAFSEEEVFNPDYGIMGIPYMAIVAPDGTVRHTGLHPAMPLAEKTVKIDALLKEFGLKVPDAKS